ncbi:MAG: metal-dependent hydrolase [Nitrososphaerota archaeon]|jgi:membrane-bound metal-dependent hydrolase YbcI (DUF457 family)|nr:metal-dependent hydrolase [Nitrososphaerota archaeon]
MLAVGHISLAYILGKISSKTLKVNPSIPLLMTLSILPDIDIAIGTLIGSTIHRGPTHSILFALIVFTPIFIIYKKRAIPYFIAYISHFLIGDFFVGGHLQLLWPLTTSTFGLHDAGFMYIGINDPINITTELLLFTLTVILIAKTRDYRKFLKNNDKKNLILIIPITTVLLPNFIGYPFSMPIFSALPIMGIAHLFYFILFTIPILTILYNTIKNHKPKHTNNKIS